MRTGVCRNIRWTGPPRIRVTAQEVTVTADVPRIPVGIDGEAVATPVPVTCTIRPGALRVRVPRNRPGATPPRPLVTWSDLWRLATGRKGGTQ
jgi:hypothetical protein